LQNILDTSHVFVPTTENPKNSHKSAMEFLYDDKIINVSDPKLQLQGYLAEPQLRFYLDPFEWRKTRTTKNPILVDCSKKYLAIPATPVSSKRCFSTVLKISLRKKRSVC
jgi:hypothetical protein